MEDRGSPLLLGFQMKEVELKDVLADLQALRKLYRFLQTGRNGMNNATSEILDNEAQLLLKSLLDGAKELVLKTYSEIIATNGSSVYGTPCSSPSEQDRAVLEMELLPSVSPSISKDAASVIQNSTLEKYTNSPIKRATLDKIEKKVETTCDFWKDVDNAFKEIESHISALQLCSELVHAAKVSRVPNGLSKVPSAIGTTTQMEKQKGIKGGLSPAASSHLARDAFLGQQVPIIQKREMPNSTHQVCGGCQKGSRQKSGIPHKGSGCFCKCLGKGNPKLNERMNQNVKGILQRTESLSQVASQRDHIPCQTGSYVCGLRIPFNYDQTAKSSPVAFKMQNVIDNQQKELLKKVLKPRSMDPNQPAVPRGFLKLSHKKSLPRQTLMDYKPTRKANESHNRRLTMVLPHQQESEDFSSSNGQQFSSGSSYNEDYLSPTDERAHHHFDSTSRKFTDLACESSSEKSSGSYSDQRDGGQSHRLSPAQAYTFHRGSQDRKVGRLRRLKNKLGLIFHHHHHHHHHHRNVDGHLHSEGGHNTSTMKHLQKILQAKNKHEDQESQAVARWRKLGVDNVPRKNQVGHFHALVEGLMQHIRQKKKPKPSKSKNGPLGKGQGGRSNKMGKKTHWWQMFQHQGGVKPLNRGRVKLGFMRKKRQLRAAKLS